MDHNAVKDNERSLILDLIADIFEYNSIREMIDLLMNSTDEAISSLIWIPERLKQES